MTTSKGGPPAPDTRLVERVAEALRLSFGHPPITDTPGAQIGERWLRAARAAIEAADWHGGCSDE